MNGSKRHFRVLAIYPNSYGLAFVVFDSAITPIDWGLKNARGSRKNDQCLRRIKKLLRRYEPDAIVLQDMSSARIMRRRRIVMLNAAIGDLAEDSGIPVHLISRVQVREAFSYLGVATKHAIAEAITKHIPAFHLYVPRIRKAWMSEDPRMGLFDAAAIAWTFFTGPKS
jgi:Holliday junction resolvasome RuvABC endonuclease subunit